MEGWLDYSQCEIEWFAYGMMCRKEMPRNRPAEKLLNAFTILLLVKVLELK